MRVLLVVMPFAAIERPSLGVSALKARLTELSLACDVAYANLVLARDLGQAAYERIANDLPYEALVGEWVFTGCLYGSDAEPADSYADDVLSGVCRMEKEDIALLLHARDRARGFIDECLVSIGWSRYDVVGFTSSSAQNIASLALAKRVATRYPDVRIAFGGWNWEGEMGRELHRRFPFVDFAFSGEADVSFPALVERLAAGDAGAPVVVPGVTYRHGGRSRTTPAAPPVGDLDALPVPDHSDYFEALSCSGLEGRLRAVVPLETARGCWWGARHPCAFCAISGPRRAFRSKSPTRIVWELRELADRWQGCRLDVVDDLVSPLHFAAVFPELASRPLPTRLSLKARPDIGRRQICAMASVISSVCAGVESLSDGLLRRMDKGTTSLENIRFLKWCKANGVEVHWNLLYGFPRETWKDYEEMLEVLPHISHLDPPEGCGPVLIERYSRYFEDPGAFGFAGVRPALAYRYVYPFPDASLRRIACYFDHDYRPGLVESLCIDRLRREVKGWRDGREAGCELRLVATKSGAVIVDTRSTAVAGRHVLDPLEHVLYEACADIRSRADLLAMARSESDDGGRDDEVDRRLSSFVDRGLMAADGDRYLSLALPAAGDGAEAEAG